MTLEQFCGLARERVPTPAEFLDFADAMGWRVEARGGRGVLKVPDRNDGLAAALARMLGREPYRTGVLAEAQRRWRGAAPAPPPAREGGPPLPGVIVWRVAGEVGWAFDTAVDRESFIATYSLAGWKLPGESAWRGLSELPPSWGFVVPEGRP